MRRPWIHKPLQRAVAVAWRAWKWRVATLWLPILLVLWVLFPRFAQISFGLTFLPVPETNAAAGILAVPYSVKLLRVAQYALYPLVALMVSRRFPLWSSSRQHIAYHVLVLAALHAIVLAARTMQSRLGFDAHESWTFYIHRTIEFLVYSAFAHAMLYAERFREKEQEELELRAELLESTNDRRRAQVRALAMRWSPDFLTGTLQSVAELLATDTTRAKRLLVSLSAALRRVLAYARSETVRLESEIELVEEILRVEVQRRAALKVEWLVEESTLELPVPHMTLLTLIYRVLPLRAVSEPLCLRITARASGDSLNLNVEALPVVDAFVNDVERAGAGAPTAMQGAPGRETDQEQTGMVSRVELHWAPEARDSITAEPSSKDDVKGSRSPSLPYEKQPVTFSRFERGTYVTFVLLQVLLALYTAYSTVVEGRIAIIAPRSVYILGSGVYAGLWCATLAIAARALTARVSIRRGNWLRGVLIHACGALIVSLLNALAFFPFQKFVVEGGSVVIGVLSYWQWGDLAIYVPLAGIAHGFVYARELRDKRLSELELRSRLSDVRLSRTEAELQSLKAELNPHFLFNALNTVSSLMHARAEEARRVVGLLSDFLRRVLDTAEQQEVTLQEEVAFVALYMKIEQARFGDVLQIRYALDPRTLDALVPHLLIQPLVENAVKHGLRPRGGAGQIVVSSTIAGDALELTVCDDGAGSSDAAAVDGTGTGLANVRRRIQQLYGDLHSFTFTAAPGSGATVRIVIPYRRARGEAPTGAGTGGVT